MTTGDIATVMVGDEDFTGIVYHVRDNGWPCVQTPTGHIASGPAVPEWAEIALASMDRELKRLEELKES